jgi:hypothetical protein
MRPRGIVPALLVLVLLITVGSASWWTSIRNSPPQAEAESPIHKSGLWELKTRLFDRSEQTNQRCIDVATDHSMFRTSDNMGRFLCSLRKPDSGCTFTVTADAEDAYALTIASSLPQGTGSMNAKWLGPCKPGQEPGRVIAPNDGKSRIIIEMRDRSPKAAEPLPK